MVRITDHAIAAEEGELILHPPVLALGVGCERDTPAAEVDQLVAETLAAEALAPGAVACVVSLDLKMDEPAVHALARALGVPARFFTAAELEAQAPRLAIPSEVVFRETGCHGVAEGAALAAAGPGALLVVAKVKGERCTVAVARAPRGIDPADNRAGARSPFHRRHRPGRRRLAHAGGVGGGRRIHRPGRLRALPRPAGPGGRRQDPPRKRAGCRDRAGPPRARPRRRGQGGVRWCARAMPASTPWPPWCSS